MVRYTNTWQGLAASAASSTRRACTLRKISYSDSKPRRERVDEEVPVLKSTSAHQEMPQTVVIEIVTAPPTLHSLRRRGGNELPEILETSKARTRSGGTQPSAGSHVVDEKAVHEAEDFSNPLATAGAGRVQYSSKDSRFGLNRDAVSIEPQKVIWKSYYRASCIGRKGRKVTAAVAVPA